MTAPATALSQEDATAARFQRDIADHQMTVLRDDGLYRHLRFKVPGTSSYWFDLVTWPGVLTINGDMETFAFARTEDMFQFFRGSRINPSYWAEKVRAQSPSGVKVYSQDRFRELIADYIGDPKGDDECAAKDWPGLAEAIEQAFFADFSFYAKWDTAHEQGAQEALNGFEFGDTWTFTCGCGEKAEGLTETDADDRRRYHLRHCFPHKPETTRVEGFRFHDTWEWDLRGYSYQFLWCLHAIQWGIAQYDLAKASAPAGGAS